MSKWDDGKLTPKKKHLWWRLGVCSVISIDCDELSALWLFIIIGWWIIQERWQFKWYNVTICLTFHVGLLESFLFAPFYMNNKLWINISIFSEVYQFRFNYYITKLTHHTKLIISKTRSIEISNKVYGFIVHDFIYTLYHTIINDNVTLYTIIYSCRCFYNYQL